MLEDRVAEAASVELAAPTSTLPAWLRFRFRIRIRTVEEWLRHGDERQTTPLPMLDLSEEFPLLVAARAKAEIDDDDDDDDDAAAGAGASRAPSASFHRAPASDRRRIRIVHIPFSELVAERAFELPPRNAEFVIFVEPARLEAAVHFLTGRSFATAASPRGGNAVPRMGAAWSVVGAILDTADTRQQIEQIALPPYDDPNQRLWHPDSMVEQHLLPLLRDRLTTRSTPTPQWSRRTVHVWDLGSGVGRDVAYLARNLRSVVESGSDGSNDGEHGPAFRVVGLDQRYKPRDAAVFRSFMQRQGVDDLTECRCVDLTVSKDRDSSIVAALVDERPECIYAVRYWNRPLFETVDRLAPRGTIVAITHFAKPTDDADWPFPHPKVSQYCFARALSPCFVAHRGVSVIPPIPGEACAAAPRAERAVSCLVGNSLRQDRHRQRSRPDPRAVRGHEDAALA
jgi:hypothetical protein